MQEFKQPGRTFLTTAREEYPTGKTGGRQGKIALYPVGFPEFNGATNQSQSYKIGRVPGAKTEKKLLTSTHFLLNSRNSGSRNWRKETRGSYF